MRPCPHRLDWYFHKRGTRRVFHCRAHHMPAEEYARSFGGDDTQSIKVRWEARWGECWKEMKCCLTARKLKECWVGERRDFTRCNKKRCRLRDAKRGERQWNLDILYLLTWGSLMRLIGSVDPICPLSGLCIMLVIGGQVYAVVAQNFIYS